MSIVGTETMTELEMLFDFAKDAQVASMSYMAAASMARDTKVRQRLERMASMSIEAQERTVKLMRKLGANV